MSRVTRVAGCCAATVAAIGLVACGSGGDDTTSETSAQGGAPQVEEVKALMAPPKSGTWYAQLVADRNGYFEDAEVKPELIPAGGSAAALQQLIAGNGDVAWVASDAAVTAFSKDPNIRALGCAERENLISIQVPEDSPVTDVAQLAGKRVGIPDAGGGETALVNAVLKGEDLVDDVEVTAVGDPGAGVKRLLESGEVAAYVGGIGDITALESAGIKLRNVTPEPFRLVPGQCLVTMADTVKDPDGRARAAAMLRGWLQGVLYSLANRTAALDVVCDEAPEACTNRELTAENVNALLDLTDAPDKAKLLALDPEAWKRSAENVAGQSGADLEALIAAPEIEQVHEAAFADLDALDKQTTEDASSAPAG